MTVLPPLHDGLLRAVRREQATRRGRGRGRRLRRGALALAGAIALSGTAVAATQVAKSLDAAVRAGERPPAPQAQRRLPLIGEPGTASLTRWRGQLVVLAFVASWCPPCEQTMPALAAVGADLRRRGEGTVVLVGVQDAARDARAFVRGQPLRMPALADRDGTLARAYGTPGIPSIYAIDRDGRVVAIRRGQTGERALRALVAKAR